MNLAIGGKLSNIFTKKASSYGEICATKPHSLILAVAGLAKKLDDFGGRLEKLENRFELRYKTRRK